MPPIALLIALAATVLDVQGQAALEPAFTGTIVSTYPDGRTGRLHLHPDGTYDGIGRRGDVSGGAWTLQRGRVCMRQRKPFWYPFAYCTTVPASPTWEATAPTGEPIHVHLEAGR